MDIGLDRLRREQNLHLAGILECTTCGNADLDPLEVRFVPRTREESGRVGPPGPPR